MLETTGSVEPAALRGADTLERETRNIPHVEAHSLLTLYHRARFVGEISAHDADRMRTFATGTVLFRRAGLWAIIIWASRSNCA